MKFKRFVYILLILLTSFVYMNSVSATTAKVCKYSKKSDYDVYLYQTANGNHYAYKMSSDGNKHKIYNASLKSNISNFSNCPEYMHIENENKNVFYFDDKQEHTLLWVSNSYNNVNYNDKSYTSWECSYDNVVVKQNKKGLISYTIDGKYSTNNYLQFYDYSFNSGTCPGYFASKAYQTDSSKLFFYKDESAVKSVNNGKTTGYTAAVDTTTKEPSSSSGKGSCNKNGDDCKYSSDLNKNSNVLIFENVGYCSKLSLAKNYSDPTASECTAAGGSSADLRFRTSSYMILTYSPNYGRPEYVYLPSNGISDSTINSRISEYKSGKAKLGYVAELFDRFVYEEISVLQSFSVCDGSNSNTSYCRITGDLDWFNFTDGVNANEYESEPVFWKKYGLSLTSLDNSKADHPDNVTDGDVNVPAATYLCTYNDGDMVMRVNTGSNSTRIFVYFPNDTKYGNVHLSYKIGDGTKKAITWKGIDNHYSSVESGNSGIFESDLAREVCPKEVNYGLGSSKGNLTICYEESDCDDVDGYVGKNPVWSLASDGDDDDPADITDCSDLISDDLRKILNKYFTLFRIIVPLIVIGLGIVDFAKAVFASKEDDMKKSQQSFMKRVIIAVAIFLIPTFVNLLMDVANTVWGWNTGTCGIEKNIDE